MKIVGAQTKKLFLLDPISGVRRETSYEAISGFLGTNEKNLACAKSRMGKLRQLNCYIIDESTPKSVIFELIEKEVIKNEIWKDIEWANGRYQVSDYGRIRRLYKSREPKIMVPFLRKTQERTPRWLFVKLTVNGVAKDLIVHRIVAEHFVENEKNLPLVYHKNENTYDNRANNLGWIDRVTLAKKTAPKSKSIPVLKLDPKTGEVLAEYRSMSDAARHNYVHKNAISDCIRGKQKTSGGFKWAIDKEEHEALESMKIKQLKRKSKEQRGA